MCKFSLTGPSPGAGALTRARSNPLACSSCSASCSCKCRNVGSTAKIYDFARRYAKDHGRKLYRDNYQTDDGKSIHKSLIDKKVLNPDTGEFLTESSKLLALLEQD